MWKGALNLIWAPCGVKGLKGKRGKGFITVWALKERQRGKGGGLTKFLGNFPNPRGFKPQKRGREFFLTQGILGLRGQNFRECFNFGELKKIGVSKKPGEGLLGEKFPPGIGNERLGGTANGNGKVFPTEGGFWELGVGGLEGFLTVG